MRSRALVVFALACPFIVHISGQSVISARSGLVNYFEGNVFLDGRPLVRKFGTFARLAPGSTLRTQSGRAEVLLTPNVYFRMGENSTIRMISDSLADTQVELLAGSASVDSANAPAGDFVKMIFRDSTIRILKPGRYRIDAEPAQLRVYEGEADVTRGGSDTKLESSQILPLDGAPVVKRFTEGSDGLLDVWSEERSSLIASNMVNSQAITDPLLDNGPGLSTDAFGLGGAPGLSGVYGGYIPLAAVPPVIGNIYGYSPYGYSADVYGLAGPYPGLAVYGVFPRAPRLYVPRYGNVPVFSSRPFPSGGVRIPPRPVFVPRPAPARHGGFHPAARR